MSRWIFISQLQDVSSDLIVHGKSLIESNRASDYKCVRCGTDLYSSYMENRVYMVVCKNCEIVHLTEANNPEQALVKIGRKIMNVPREGIEDEKL